MEKTGNKRVLLVLDRGFYHFENQLLPVARMLHQLYGMDAVLVTFHPEECSLERLQQLEDASFLTLDTAISGARPNGYTEEHTEMPRRSSGPVWLKALLVIPKRIKKIFQWRKRAQNLLQCYQPDAIILQKGNHEEVPFLVKQAKRCGIVTIALQTNWGAIYRGSLDGMFFRSGNLLSDLKQWGYTWVIHTVDILTYALLATPIKFGDIRGHKTKGQVDYFAIEDEIFCNPYIRNGVKKAQLVVTGAPEGDEFVLKMKAFSTDEESRLRASLDTQSKVNVLLFLLTNGRHFGQTDQMSRMQRLTELITFLASAHPDLYIWLSVHPRDQQSTYEILMSLNSRVRIVENTTPQVYFTSSLVLSEGSTSMLYAEWAGKPTTIYPLIIDHSIHAGKAFQVGIQNSHEALYEWITSNLSQGKAMNANKWPYCTDGNACERIANLVERHVTLSRAKRNLGN